MSVLLVFLFLLKYFKLHWEIEQILLLSCYIYLCSFKFSWLFPCTYIFLALCCRSTILSKFVFILSVTSSYYVFQAGLPSCDNLNKGDSFFCRKKKNDKSINGLLKHWRNLTSENKMLFYVVLILIQNENVLHFKRVRFGRYKIQEGKDMAPPHLELHDSWEDFEINST